MSVLPLADGINVEDLIIWVLFLILAGLFSLIKRMATKRPADSRPADRTAPPPPSRPPVIPRRPVPPEAMRRSAVPTARRSAARRPPAPVPQPQMEPVSWDVTEELRRQLACLQQDEAERVHRFTTAAPAEADTAGIEARLVSVRPAAGPTAAAPIAHGMLAELKAPDALRRAILHYEVFAPPKALRKTPEAWEL